MVQFPCFFLFTMVDCRPGVKMQTEGKMQSVDFL